MVIKKTVIGIVLISQVMIVLMAGEQISLAQTEKKSPKVASTPTLEKTPLPKKKDDEETISDDSDDLEIAVFTIPQTQKPAVSEDRPESNRETSETRQQKKTESEKEPTTVEVPSQTEKSSGELDSEKIQEKQPSDFVVDFEGLPQSVVTSSSEETDEEFSLEMDGAFVPGAKLFTQLLAEAEEKERAEQEKSARQNEPTQNFESVVNNPSYVKKTTIVTTTTTTFGKNNANLSVLGLPSVNATTIATQDAYRLVRLAAMGDGVPLPVEWAQHMVDAGRTHGIDPVLILEVCRQESRFRNSARSGANAHGLMQFIPETAARFGIDPYNPKQAIFGGAKYLRFLLDTFRGEVRSALAGYNAGEGAVIAFATGRTLYPKKGKIINSRGIRTAFGIPPYKETQEYVSVIYSKYLNSLERLRRL